MENEYNYNPTTDNHTRRNVLFLILVLVILIVGGFTIYEIVHKSTNNTVSTHSTSKSTPKVAKTTPAPKTTTPAAPAKTGTPNSTGAANTSATNNTAGLTNTGPGSTVALFVGVAALGSLGYSYYQRRQAVRAHR